MVPNSRRKMFAVIKTGGKQYKVAENDIISVEKLLGEPGDKLELNEVLMLGEDGKAPKIGSPLVEKARVIAEILEQSKDDKIIVFKKKRRHNYRRKRGHRQNLTVLKVLEVTQTSTKVKSENKSSTKKETTSAQKTTQGKKAASTKKAAPAKKASTGKTGAKVKNDTPKKAPAKKPRAKKSPD